MKWNKEKSNIIVTGSAANRLTMEPNIMSAVTSWHINIKARPQYAGDYTVDKWHFANACQIRNMKPWTFY